MRMLTTPAAKVHPVGQAAAYFADCTPFMLYRYHLLPSLFVHPILTCVSEGSPPEGRQLEQLQADHPSAKDVPGQLISNIQVLFTTFPVCDRLENT